MAETKTLRINEKAVVVGPAEPSTPLLYFLRNDADLHGPDRVLAELTKS